MKNLWKLSSFPANGSSEKGLSKSETEKVIKAVKSEIDEIKSEIQKPIFEDRPTSSNVDSLTPMKLLGEFLSYLRKEKSMSLLMLARQISKIEIEGKTAVIYSDDDDMMSLQTNEKHHGEVLKFFESKGLGFKVHENEKTTTEVDELKRLLGPKLVIK